MRRRPLHLAVLVGASTALYAISLAGVTALQSSDDRRLIARQAPAATRRRGSARVTMARGRLAAAAGAYAYAATDTTRWRRARRVESSLDATLAASRRQRGGPVAAGRVSLPPV